MVLRLTAVRHAEGLLEQIATSHPRGLTGESWSEPEICAPSRHPGLCRPRTTPENYCLIHHQVSQERSFRFTPEQVTGSQVPVDCDPGKYALSPFSTLLSISPSPQTLASFALTDLCLIKPHMGKSHFGTAPFKMSAVLRGLGGPSSWTPAALPDPFPSTLLCPGLVREQHFLHQLSALLPMLLPSGARRT